MSDLSHDHPDGFRGDWLRRDDAVFDNVAAEIAAGMNGYRSAVSSEHRAAAENVLAFLEEHLRSLSQEVSQTGTTVNG